MNSRPNNRTMLTEIARYYSAKLEALGETAAGVDWNSEESQLLRFSQLIKVIAAPSDISVNDLGCGYGALYPFLIKHFDNIHYHGCDISQSMISAARRRFAAHPGAEFHITASPPVQADYGIASGIFNVCLSNDKNLWLKYIQQTLHSLNQTSKRGFAFNCLTSYSDKEKMRDDLYYASPCALFDYCKRNFSNNVALLHDYGLYEFTILVKKKL